MNTIKTTLRGLSVIKLAVLLLITGGVWSPALAQSETGLVNLIALQSGMQRISYQQLADQGVDLAGVRHRRLGVTLDGEAVAVATTGQSKEFGKKSLFGPGGHIEFYADVPEDLYHEGRAFTLHYNGPRLAMRSVRNKFKKKNASVSQYLASKVVENNLIYDFLAPSANDPWHYGRFIASGAGDTLGTSVDFTLDNLLGSSADLVVEVFGIVDIDSDTNDHHYGALINGVERGDQQFDGSTVDQLAIPAVPVNSGNNTFRLFSRSIAGNPFDGLALNKLSFRYLSNTLASDDYLQGEFVDPQILVTGFSSDAVNVYRVDGDNAYRITGGKQLDSDYGFSTGGVNGVYAAVGENGYRLPTVAMLTDEVDISSGDAEYLIISHASLMGAELDALVAMRSADYSVKVVDVAQIYAQFGDHLPDSAAIRAYIDYAVANMGTRFVLLVGADTYDYKQRTSSSVSFIPTNYVGTQGGLLFISQTPSDALYGDIDRNEVPEIPVGRLSVRTPGELDTVVQKIAAYQARQGYAGDILISADQADAGNDISFTDDAMELIAEIPQPFRDAIQGPFLALPDVDGGAAARQKILDGINAGVAVTAYIGHSDQDYWSRATPPLLTVSDIATLQNDGKPTLVTQWGCWNAYFVDPDGNNMADKFLVGGLNGAVTVLGASTLTSSAGERILGVELNKHMYNQGTTIGEAIVNAKAGLASVNPRARDILLGWQIIGDPALKVNP